MNALLEDKRLMAFTARSFGPMEHVVKMSAVNEVFEELKMRVTQPLNELANEQLEWLISVGWVGKTTPLEDLMLVVSECGEAANEVRGESPTEEFQTELADIILRVLGLAAKNGIDIDSAVRNKMQINRERGTRGRLK